MKYSKFTYQKSGVNIHAADKFVNFISKNTGKKTKKTRTLGDLDQFLIYQNTLKTQKL